MESYALRADGRIDNGFTCREKSFAVPMKRKATTIATVYDNRWAVIGHPSRRYGWIISRTRTLPEPTYQAILQRLTAQGNDVAKSAKVPQREPARPVASQ